MWGCLTSIFLMKRPAGVGLQKIALGIKCNGAGPPQILDHSLETGTIPFQHAIAASFAYIEIALRRNGNVLRKHDVRLGEQSGELTILQELN